MVNPDQASLDVGVITTAGHRAGLAAQNATQTTAVISAVKAVLNGAGTVQTQNYSVSPRYAQQQLHHQRLHHEQHAARGDHRPRASGPADRRRQRGGGNTVGNLGFGLQDPDPSVQQALVNATKQAMAHANAIAGGLGGKVGAVVSAHGERFVFADARGCLLRQWRRRNSYARADRDRQCVCQRDAHGAVAVDPVE